MDLHQFYPTPYSLTLKAVKRFKKQITRLLEPSAGRADLLKKWTSDRGYRSFDIDCVEIDSNNVAILQKDGFRVVGHDFMEFNGPAIYSHVLMNPPFRDGVSHVLKAYEKHLYSGELVAILNASSIRNASTLEEKRLCNLIDECGSVEFIQQSFMAEDTQRTTQVEIALIYLTKDVQLSQIFAENLRVDKAGKGEVRGEFIDVKELSIPGNRIRSMVTAFECAVDAAHASVVANLKARSYADWLPKSLLDESTSGGASDQDLIAEFCDKYQKLKERAWTSILRSTDVLERLSSSAQKRLESEFSTIRELEFSIQNIYGLLHGLVEQQKDIQIEMICDVFDSIGRYHHKNHLYYQGWKSNSKHRVNAFKIMSTRFILPANRRDWYKDCSLSSNLCFDDSQMMADIDKVFCLLDGKHHTATTGLKNLFANQWKELVTGDRCTSEYFDMRFYPGAGTFHFFPRRLDLVEMLNRIVGKRRQWLPEDDADASPEFMEQYEKADVVAKHMKTDGINYWQLQHGNEYEKEKQTKKLNDMHREAVKKEKINFDPDKYISDDRQLLSFEAPSQEGLFQSEIMCVA